MVSETVSLGAAYMAGLTAGFWADLETLRKNWHLAARWEPRMDPARRQREIRQWDRAVERAYGWSPG
jgi:glycerol kinase